MKRRFAKEVRPLVLPWAIACMAGCLPLDLFGGYFKIGTEILGFLRGCLSFTFCGSLVLLAAMSFGTEFQHRTLPLLLAQPLGRSRIWAEKMLVLVAGVASVGLLCWVSRGCLNLAQGVSFETIADQFPLPAAILAGTLTVATICSIGFWTLLARSTIGGAVLTVASLCFAALGITLALQKMYGRVLAFEDPIVTRVIVVACLVYSATLLLLGWRKFDRLELRDTLFGAGNFGSVANDGGRWSPDWLRCRPAGSLRNLVRKELCLQKPVLMIAAVFSLLWLLTLALLFLEPARKEVFENVLVALAAFYVPVSLLLAGCVPLGEEKILGLTAWHLTLPISAWRQWMAKLAVGVGAASALGVVLPVCLAWLTVRMTGNGLPHLLDDRHGGWLALIVTSALMFPLSFWAVTLLGNTVRAALTAVLGLGVLGVFAALGLWCGDHSNGNETALLSVLISWFHLRPDFLSAASFEFFVLGLTALPVLLLALAQSFRQFRRSQPQPAAFLKCSAVLALAAFVFSFWGADLEASRRALPVESSAFPATAPVHQIISKVVAAEVTTL